MTSNHRAGGHVWIVFAVVGLLLTPASSSADCSEGIAAAGGDSHPGLLAVGDGTSPRLRDASRLSADAAPAIAGPGESALECFSRVAVRASAARAGRKGPLQDIAAMQPRQVETATIAADGERQWAVSFVTGTTSSGPAPDLEQAMRNAQFDESRGICVLGGACLPGTEHPFSNTGWGAVGFPWHVGVQRRLSSWYGVGVSGGRAAVGSTFGQKRDRADFLEIAYRVTTIAPTFNVDWSGWVRAAAGPAMYSTTFESDRAETHHALGLLGEFAVTLPTRTRIFGEFLAQYRRAGTVNIGPFSARPGTDSTLPATEVKMDHWLIGLGVGLRF